MWRTLLDEFNATGAVPDELPVVDMGADVPYVRCACQRVTPADMMYRFEGRWICDGCEGRERRTRGIGRREMAQLMGGKRTDSPKPTRPYAGGRRALDVREG